MRTIRAKHNRKIMFHLSKLLSLSNRSALIATASCIFGVWCAQAAPVEAPIAPAGSLEPVAALAPLPSALSLADNGSLTLGNPSAATSDDQNNLLVLHTTYALAFDKGTRGAKWVSWHLDDTDQGKSGRSNMFRPDPLLPESLQVHPNDYRGSGYDRGHQCPSGDRTSDKTTNEETFYMSNMLPQAPDLNRQVWRKFEEYLRSQLKDGTNEIYIVSGGVGTLGRIGEGGAIVPVIVEDALVAAPAVGDIAPVAPGINIPAKCWKVALILPVGDGDLKRIDANTRVIAVEMPNVDGEATSKGGWRDFLVTTDAIEAETGLDFFSLVPVEVQKVIEAKVDSGRAPRTSNKGAAAEADETDDGIGDKK